MGDFTLELNCSFCKNEYKSTINIPGWTTRYESLGEENALCPDHAKIREFSNAQCPGCVEGWGDCALFKAFAYSGQRSLTDEDYDKIRHGICPRRTNGTISINSLGKFEALHLDEMAPTESGELLAKSIMEYIAEWPDHA